MKQFKLIISPILFLFGVVAFTNFAHAQSSSFECDFPHEGDLEIEGSGCVISSGTETGIDQGSIDIAPGATLQMESNTELIFEPGEEIRVDGFILRPTPRNAIIRKAEYEVPKPFAGCEALASRNGWTFHFPSAPIEGRLYAYPTPCIGYLPSTPYVDVSGSGSSTYCPYIRGGATLSGGNSTVGGGWWSGSPGGFGTYTTPAGFCTVDGQLPTELAECPFSRPDNIGDIVGKHSRCNWSDGYTALSGDGGSYGRAGSCQLRHGNSFVMSFAMRNPGACETWTTAGGRARVSPGSCNYCRIAR